MLSSSQEDRHDADKYLRVFTIPKAGPRSGTGNGMRRRLIPIGMHAAIVAFRNTYMVSLVV